MWFKFLYPVTKGRSIHLNRVPIVTKINSIANTCLSDWSFSSASTFWRASKDLQRHVLPSQVPNHLSIGLIFVAMTIFRIDLNSGESPSPHVPSGFLQENHRSTPPEIYNISEVILPQVQLWKVCLSHLLGKDRFLQGIWGASILKTPNSRRK